MTADEIRALAANVDELVDCMMGVSSQAILRCAAAALRELVEDRERWSFVKRYLHDAKWWDVLPDLRPRDATGDYTEKYIDENTVDAAIDAAMRAEREEPTDGE